MHFLKIMIDSLISFEIQIEIIFDCDEKFNEYRTDTETRLQFSLSNKIKFNRSFNEVCTTLTFPNRIQKQYQIYIDLKFHQRLSNICTCAFIFFNIVPIKLLLIQTA